MRLRQLFGSVSCAAVLAIGACTPKSQDRDEPPLVLTSRFGPSPPVARELVLNVRAQPKLEVGEELGLELELRNESSEPLTVVRPVCAGYSLPSHVSYELEWTDQDGEPILDPLGFATHSSCTPRKQIERADLVTIEAGASAKIPRDPRGPEHVVQATARPGHYTLRVRYLARGIEAADEVQLLSEPVEIEITQGDAASWKCRAEQLAAASDYVERSVNPVALVQASDGQAWLVVRTQGTTVVGGESQSVAEIWMQRIGRALNPVGDPELIRRTDERNSFDVSAAAVADEVLVLSATTGRDRGLVGQRVDLAGASQGGHPQVSQPWLIQAGGTGSVRTIGLREGFAVLDDRLESGQYDLTLRVMSPSGKALVAPRIVSDSAYDFALVSTDPHEFAALWIDGPTNTLGVLQRFDAASGEPLAEPITFEFDSSPQFVGARIHEDTVELAWTTTGDGFDGIYARPFALDDGHPRGPARELSRYSSFHNGGAVAWYGEEILVSDVVGTQLLARVGERAQLQLSDTSGFSVSAPSVVVLVTRSGYLLLWSDMRDDRSNSCTVLDDCETEVHGALIGIDGERIGGPRRLTSLAQLGPFEPRRDLWTEYCP